MFKALSKNRSLLQALAVLLAAMVYFALPALSTAESAPISAAVPVSGYQEQVIFDTHTSSGSVQSIISEQEVAEMSCNMTAGVSALVNANVQVVKDNGVSSNRVDIVFLGDGYSAGELGKYSSSVSQLSSSIFLQSPLYEYSNYFNIHRIDTISAESGIDNDPAPGIDRNTVLDGQFFCQNADSTLCINVSKALDYAALARNFDQIVVLVNSSKIGSAAYPFSDLAVVSADQGSAADSLVHEFGHSFANLADEGDVGIWPDYTGFEPAEPNASAQTAQSMTAQGLKWFRWLGTDLGPNYGGLVGTYEGAMGHQFRIYRPSTNSKMRSLQAPFNLPSTEAAIMQIYRLVSPIDDATPPNAALSGLSTLFVKPLQPLDHSLSVQWYINGAPANGATADTFHPNDYPLADGIYNISVKVTDKTQFVRDEAFRAQYMTASRSWNVPVDQNPPVILIQPSAKTVFVGQSAAFSVTAQGDELKYQWYRNGAVIPGATSPVYTAPAAVKGDSGSQFSVKVSNIAGTVTSNNAQLTVPNRKPVIGSIFGQLMARSQSKTVQLSVSDPDGDQVSLSAVVVPQTAAPGAAVSIQNTSLTIQTGSSFIGQFYVTVTATDQAESVSQTFAVTVVNQLPTLASIPGQSMNWKKDSIAVTISGSDNDGETLTYSAQLEGSTGVPVNLSLNGTVLTIDPASGYQGLFNIKVSATDGISTVSTSFPVNVYNTAPVLAPINNQTMFWKTNSIQVTLNGSDADDDPLTYSAVLGAGAPLNATVSVSGKTLTIDPPNDYQGSFIVTARVSDGDKFGEKSFWVYVTNGAPVVQKIPDQMIHWKTDFVTVPVVASDPDGDALSYSAFIPGGGVVPVTLTYNGTILKIDPAPGYVGIFNVTVRVSDGNFSADQTFKVEVYHRRPVLSVIPDQRMHYKLEPERTITLAADSPDGETLTFSADVIGSVSPEPEISVTGNKLKIQVAEGVLTRFSITVTASDGDLSDSKSFLVSTYNTAPDLTPICDRAISWSNLPFNMGLTAVEPDGEPMTYSAEAEEWNLPFQLDQIYNFSQPSSGWNYNLTGQSEKYIQGDRNQGGSPQWFMILPSGALYQSGGSLNGSTLIAKLPAGYYTDPTLLFDVPAHTGVPVITVEGEGLTIAADPEFRGTFLIRARADDGQLFDEEPFLVTVYDEPIRIDSISTVRMHWTEDKKRVPLSYVNPDGSPSGSGAHYTGTFAAPGDEYALDQQWNFLNLDPSLRSGWTADNAAGLGEKYVVAGPDEGNGSASLTYLFAILPTGDIYKIPTEVWITASGGYWGYIVKGPTIATGTFVGRVNPVFYADPSMLADVPSATVPPPISLTVDHNDLVIDPETGFTGKVLISVAVTDDIHADNRIFLLDIYNTTPKVDNVAPPALGMGYPVISVSYRQRRLEFPISGSDADAPDASNIQYSARLGAWYWIPYELYSNQLSVPAGGIVFNRDGWREKHFDGIYQGSPADFAILPSGEVFVWRGSYLSSTLMARVQPSFYDTPASFIQLSRDGGTKIPFTDVRPAGVTVEKVGAKMAVEWPEGFIGGFSATVVGNDGNRMNFSRVYINSTNFAPSLAPIADRTMAWRSGSTIIQLPGSDPDGDPLTYGAALTTTAPVTLAVSGSQLNITPQIGYLGEFTIRATVTDGTSTDARLFKVKVTDTAPVIQGIADQKLGYKEIFTVPISAVDPEGDPVTLSAAPAAGSANLIAVVLTGNTLKVTPKTTTGGTARVTLTASDGLLSSQFTFSLVFENRAPVLAPINLQTIKWREGSRTLALSATDADNDAIIYSAAVTNTPAAATVAVSGKNLTFTLKNFYDTFYITAYASDGVSTASQTFRVNMTNSAPVISTIPNQSFHWRNSKQTVALQVSDPDGETPAVSAKLSAGSSHPVTMSVSGPVLSLNFSQQKIGSFYVDVSAKDLLKTVTSTFKVTLTNGKPEIDRVPDQFMAAGTRTVEIGLDATDPNDDPLTYSAAIRSAPEVVYDYDQLYNFDLLAADFGYNKLGNKEKYFRGTKPGETTMLTFVIYPTGQLYQWSGQLTTSKYLGTLPLTYYTTPNLLFNVAAPAASAAPGTLSLTGKQLRVMLNSGYSGNFYVKASASDTQDQANTYFGVSAGAAGGVVEDPIDGCQTDIKIHHGDYTCDVTTAFVAEGRIGDTVTADYNRTFELDISKSSSGPFAQGETSNYVWVNNKRTNFTLSFNSTTKTAQFIVDGKTVSHITNFTGNLTDIFIRANSTLESAGLTIDQLKLNGESISDSVSTSQCSSSANVLQITAPNAMIGNFTLTGVATMSFSSSSSRKVKNSELAFQITLANQASHETYCGEEGDGKKVTVCHIPPGNPGNAHTIRISTAALEDHLDHGDIIGECPGAPSDPGDGGGTCAQKQIIASPNYTLWNSFLGMTDILELTNPTTSDLPVKISFYSILGQLKHQITVRVPAVNQLDVILNDFPGFVKDSYGVVKLEFSGPLDGRMMYYRPSTDGAGYDFAFDQPLNDASFGTTAVSFNTFQPSQKDDERDNLVANWLSVVNLDSSPQGYTINTYDNLGNLILRRQIEVPAFGRADVDGGHDLAGPNVVGVHIITPNSVTAEYIALITRFGGNAPRGYVSSKYKFAFPLAAKLGQSDPIYMPISRKFNEYNWIEVVNILDRSVGASINYYGKNGRLIESVDATFLPHSQLHFNAGSNLAEGETGYAVVVPREPYSLIAQSMGYLRESSSGSVTAVYGSQARRALPCLQSGSYNLYLTMQNWLLVANTTNDQIEATIHLTGPNLQSEKSLILAPRASVYLPIHDLAQFGARPDTYGLISVTPKDSSLRLFAEVMRVRYRPNGMPDFAAPTPIR